MPSRFGFEVKVVDGSEGIQDPEREAFVEYGTRVIAPTKSMLSNTIQTSGVSKRLVTTKIECKTDQKFFIRIRPEGGWPGMENLTVYTNSPYVFSMEVYIDGNSKAELDVVLMSLDPKQYTTTKGQYYRGRTIIAESDATPGKPRVYSQGWKFTELGIELQIGQLSLDTAEATEADRNEEQPRQNQVGQIVVKIYRCVVTGTSPLFSATLIGSAKATQNTAFNHDATHHAQLHEGVRQENVTSPITTRPYEEEGAWATFVFQYMDREKLEKLGLCDHNGEPVSASLARPSALLSSEAVAEGPRTAQKRKADGVMQRMDFVLRPKPQGH